MKNNLYFISKQLFNRRLFKLAFILVVSINIQQANAQCVGDTEAPLPDNPNLPDITGVCSVLLTRPTAYDVCENKAISGTVPANKLTYGVGTYTVTWTYADGSANTFSQDQKVTVTAIAAPTITSNRSTFICTGDSVTLSTGIYKSYLWKNTAGSTYTTNSVKVKTGSTFTLTVTTNEGCTSSAIQKVTQNSVLPATPVITVKGSLSICSGKSVTLKSSSPTDNTWTGGSKLDSLVVTTPGTYSVTVTNGCGSARSIGKTVVVKPLTASITATGSLTVCQGEVVTLIANAKSGITWTGGSTKDSLTVYVGKKYTLTLNNGCGPVTTDSKTLTVIPLPAKPKATPLSGCASATAIPLSGGTPEGGAYSGNGVIGTNYVPLIGDLLGGLLGGLGGGGSTSNKKTITYTITDPGTGCTNSVNTILTLDTTVNCGVEPILDSVTNIANNGTTFVVNVYPNPTNGLLNISIKNANSQSLFMSLTDALGTKTFSSTDKIESGDYYKQVNLDGLSKGVYSLKLILGDEQITEKLIIQ